jgi:hypothetical protein
VGPRTGLDGVQEKNIFRCGNRARVVQPTEPSQITNLHPTCNSCDSLRNVMGAGMIAKQGRNSLWYNYAIKVDMDNVFVSWVLG